MSDAKQPFPWPEVMQFGFGVLHLAPRDFWSMSVRELEAAYRAHAQEVVTPVSRSWLKQAMQQSPDTLPNTKAMK